MLTIALTFGFVFRVFFANCWRGVGERAIEKSGVRSNVVCQSVTAHRLEGRLAAAPPHDPLQAIAAGVALRTSAVARLTFAVARFSAATMPLTDDCA